MTKGTALFLVECDVNWARKRLEEIRNKYDTQLNKIFSGEITAIDSYLLHQTIISTLETLIEALEEDLRRIE